MQMTPSIDEDRDYCQISQPLGEVGGPTNCVSAQTEKNGDYPFFIASTESRLISDWVIWSSRTSPFSGKGGQKNFNCHATRYENFLDYWGSLLLMALGNQQTTWFRSD